MISGKGHPRIAPVEQPDEEQSELLAKTLMGPDGQPLNVFKTLARVPQLGRRVNALGGYFMRHGDFPLRERELVILRTAALCRSDYEIGQHRWIGREMAGLSDAEIEAALDSELAFEWSEDDELVLAATDELIDTDTISEPLWDRLRQRFTEKQCLELTVLIGFYRLLAGVLNSVGVELDPAVAERV